MAGQVTASLRFNSLAFPKDRPPPRTPNNWCLDGQLTSNFRGKLHSDSPSWIIARKQIGCQTLWSLNAELCYFPNSEVDMIDGQTPPPTAQPWCSKAARTFGKGGGYGRGVLGLSDASPFNHLFVQIPKRPFYVPKICPIILLLLDVTFPKI